MRWDRTGSQNIHKFEANIYMNMNIQQKQDEKKSSDFEFEKNVKK